ncbi:Ldh family oxidoreductase [Roseomonas aerophila]|uniref:Ldh family oxidoreductase n=1 Tax=Teichococcus aerophilus TaxID=1224513 RepID=A0ABR7RJN8_9PROT|nr:Ldh family oxidoreductase [Pseudoroseomonas aerophila]MBC9206347.1 Ldh family oxidoreductase [Pseudoroseomonas aerophila]
MDALPEAPALVNVSADSIRQQILAILRRWDMPEDLAAATAEAMVETDLMGVDSHGISMLTMYEGMQRDGLVTLQSRPRIVLDLPALALVDGGANLGHPVAVMAMQLACDKAAAGGIGAVGVRNSHHFGAAGYYARLAAARGLVALITSSARTVLMVPARGTVPLLGSNPIAFAAPMAGGTPFVLDMATSTVAANKVKVYELNGKPLPPGWVVDDAGAPVTAASQAMDIIFRQPGGGMTPLGGPEATGGHKGYGLGMMVQILSATLTGAAFAPLHARTRGAAEPDDIGHFFLALDPRALRPDGGFEEDLAAMASVLRGSPAADPARPVLVPGDPEEAERTRRARDGIPIPAALDRQLREICGRSGADYLLQPT